MTPNERTTPAQPGSHGLRAGVALDIGGTKIAASPCDSDGTLTGPIELQATPATQGGAAVMAAATDLLQRVKPSSAEFIAVSSAGVIDPDSGVVRSATDQIAGWPSTDIQGVFTRACGVPTAVINDGHAFALGEHWFGAGRGHPSLLLVSVGTGIGGSYVENGRVHFGARAFGGHFGHVTVPEAGDTRCTCGASGHAEAVGSGAGIARTYQRLVGDRRINSIAATGSTTPDDLLSVKTLAGLVDSDPDAAAALRMGARAVGTVIGSLTNAIDPHIVVVTGGVSAAGPEWWSSVLEAAQATVMPSREPTPIELSPYGPEMALRGAARYAAERLSS